MSPILICKMDPSDRRIQILFPKYVCSFRMGPILNRKLDLIDYGKTILYFMISLTIR